MYIIRGNFFGYFIASSYFSPFVIDLLLVQVPTPEHTTITTINTNDRTKHQSKLKNQGRAAPPNKITKYMNKMKDEGIIDLYITKA